MKTCKNCAEYWWCKQTWDKKYSADEEIDCKVWKQNHKYERRD